MWSPHAHDFSSGDDRMYVDPTSNTNASNLRWIAPYCRPDVPRVLAALVLFVVDKILIMLVPILAGMIVDLVIVDRHLDQLLPLCGAMVGATLVRTCARYGYQMLMERFGQNSIYRLVSDQYEKLHSLDFTYFNHTRTGDIMNRLTADTDAIRHFLSWVTYNVVDCVCLFIGSLAAMFTIEWRLALALLVITPFLAYCARQLAKHARPLFLSMRESLARLNSMVEENIEGNRVVQAFVREPYEIRKLDEHNAAVDPHVCLVVDCSTVEDHTLPGPAHRADLSVRQRAVVPADRVK
ncbi:MAG: ABC transporter ATP-binding protein [Actinomyces sp.]|nr:ABC transporter ATP-binding protein [Actinomyces sp.]MDU2983087.1 ABC transporter ATP-binding protein [Actinomyces sp.]